MEHPEKQSTYGTLDTGRRQTKQKTQKKKYSGWHKTLTIILIYSVKFGKNLYRKENIRKKVTTPLSFEIWIFNLGKTRNVSCYWNNQILSTYNHKLVCVMGVNCHSRTVCSYIIPTDLTGRTKASISS